VATAQAIEAGLEVAEAVASKTGVFDREAAATPPGEPRRRYDVAMIALVFLLVGGGGVSTLTGIFSGDGTAALEKAAVLEKKLDAMALEVADNAKKVQAVETSSARMLRQQARVLAWLVEASQRQSAALAAVAKSAGVEVDLVAPPLLPEVGND
jgi:hypothetical protein